METPLFFPGRGGRLFGVLHGVVSADPAATGVVFCHPFGEEKLWAHRVFVTFAREIARRGHPVLRFDYRGNGDSEGEFESWSLAGAVEDIGCAIDELRGRTGTGGVILLGLRLGAALAALAADSRPDVCGLVMWAPVVNGGQYAQDLLRVNLATQLAVYRAVTRTRDALVQSLRDGATVNVDGYELTRAPYEELAAMRLGPPARQPGIPCLVVQVSPRQPVQPDPALVALQRLYGPRAEMSMAVEDPFWKEIPRFYDAAPNLFTPTLEWLSRCGRCAQ